MPITALYLRTRRPVDYGVTPGSTTINRRGRDLLRRVANVVVGAVGARADADYTMVYSGSTEPAFANSGLAISGGTGTIGVTVNGVAVTVTSGVSDTSSAGLIAAAVNASVDPLVLGFVTANNLTATATLVSVAAGTTIDICGYRFTATTGTPPLTVSGGNLGTFDISGNDAADATALAAAINQMPGLCRFIAAVPVSNVVRLFARRFAFTSPDAFAWPSGPDVPPNVLAASAASVTLSGAALAAGAFVALNSCVPGVSANAVTIAASGTGVTTLNSEARLTRGTGLNLVGITDSAGGVG